MPTIAIDDLGLDEGAALLLKRALRELAPGARLGVVGSAPELPVHLAGWCRARGHRFVPPRAGDGVVGFLERGPAESDRWSATERAGAARRGPDAVVERPRATWGLAARGAAVEAGAPAFAFPLSSRDAVWSDDAARLYAQAAAAQWDPATAIPWDDPFRLPDDVEDAVVQVMTYLVENENAALLVPARFLGQLHPHFREVMQLLAVQAADEARHVEVFTRRILLRGREPALSTAGGQSSLKTLVDEPDFSVALFLLSVLGEGTFVNLLGFLQAHAPDRVTREVARLAGQDEARHVAFGMAHLKDHLARDPAVRERLARAVERRHESLAGTDGLNEEVLDALVLLAAGSWGTADLRSGHARVRALQAEMAAGRRMRLERLGFANARELSALHTRNFM